MPCANLTSKSAVRQAHTQTSAPSTAHGISPDTATTAEIAAPPHKRYPLFGFRSNKTWHKACALLFFTLLYALFVLTMFPPITASNIDVLIYKTIRLLLFAIPLLSVLFLSDFKWCKHLPFFSSKQRSQRALGIATLTALLLCLSINGSYLHTFKYRESLNQKVTFTILLSPLAAMSESHSVDFPIDTLESSPLASVAPNNTDESLERALNAQREGCGTD